MKLTWKVNFSACKMQFYWSTVLCVSLFVACDHASLTQNWVVMGDTTNRDKCVGLALWWRKPGLLHLFHSLLHFHLIYKMRIMWWHLTQAFTGLKGCNGITWMKSPGSLSKLSHYFRQKPKTCPLRLCGSMWAKLWENVFFLSPPDLICLSVIRVFTKWPPKLWVRPLSSHFSIKQLKTSSLKVGLITVVIMLWSFIFTI